MLQRLHIAAGRIVEDAADEGGAGALGRLQLSHRHVEAAIAGQRHHATPLPHAKLRADAARHAIADGGEAAIRDEAPPGPLRVVEQRAPMRREAAIGDQHGVFRHHLVQLAQKPADIDRALGRLQAFAGARAPFRHALRHFRAPARPRRGAPPAIGQRRTQILQRRPRIAGQRDIGTRGPPDLLGQHIHMDHRHAGGHQREALGRDLTQLAAHHQQAIRHAHQVVGDPRIAPEDSGRERMGAGDRALAGHGVRDGDALVLREAGQGLLRLTDMDAAAGQDQRPFGLGQQRCGAREVGGIGPHAAGLGAQRAGIHPEISRVEIMFGMRDILRHRDQHRAGTARGRNREGAAQKFGDAGDHLDPDRFLHQGAQHLDLLGLLRHVLPGVLAVGVADDRDHRHARVERLRQACRQVGRARAEGAVHQPRLVGHARIGIGGKRAAAFVVDQVVLHMQRPAGFVEGQQLEAAHAEHRRFEKLQHLGEGLAAGHAARGVGRHSTHAPEGRRRSRAPIGRCARRATRQAG